MSPSCKPKECRISIQIYISSCLKPFAQLEPNFDGIVIGWPSSKIVSGSHALPWSEGRTTRHNFGKGPFNDYFIKVWFQLSTWFQTRRFLCEFPIGSYVKLSSAVGAILVQLEPNFDGIVIGWSSSKIVSGSHALPPRWPPQCSCVVIESSFDPGVVLIELLVPEKMVFM
jgi:hypothetical protein